MIYNLSLLMRVTIGKGTPKQWAATVENAIRTIRTIRNGRRCRMRSCQNEQFGWSMPKQQASTARLSGRLKNAQNGILAFSTGCLSTPSYAVDQAIGM